MKLSYKILSAVLLSSAVSSVALAGAEHNHEVEYNMISLSASATKQVSNDLMQANLSIEKSHKQPSELAQQVNQLMNFATATAKKYPTVKIKTGQQHTYPIYDEQNNRKLKEWRANASVNLESQDFAATSKLIAELQQQFQLQGVSFSVSDEQRKKVEDELLTEVSKNFQHRAKLLTQSWNKTQYDLVNFNLETQHNQYYAAPMMAMSRQAKVADAIDSQDMNVGESKVTINAHGSIQLK